MISFKFLRYLALFMCNITILSGCVSIGTYKRHQHEMDNQHYKQHRMNLRIIRSIELSPNLKLWEEQNRLNEELNDRLIDLELTHIKEQLKDFIEQWEKQNNEKQH